MALQIVNDDFNLNLVYLHVEHFIKISGLVH